jgi:hypothetical protein
LLQNWGEEDRITTRRRHTPDQIIRKLAEGHKLLGAGTELALIGNTASLNGNGSGAGQTVQAQHRRAP